MTKTGAARTFTILTTDPNELMEPVHNRMPVILALKIMTAGSTPATLRARRSICCAPTLRSA